MGLLSKLKTMFNKNKQINTKDTTIVPYDTSLVILPQYKELSKEEQEEVEKYKQEIKSGDVSSLTLYAGKLSEYANVNVTLLTKVYFKLTNQPADWQLEKMDLEEIMRMRLEAKVNIEELHIYLAGLKKLEQESILRAVAVEEVRKQENKRKFEFLGLFSQAERMHRKNQLEQISSAKERMLITIKTMEQLMQAVNNTIENEEKIETAIDVYNVVLKSKMEKGISKTGKNISSVDIVRSMGADFLLPYLMESARKNALIQKLEETSELAELIFQEKEGILNSQEIKDHTDTDETEVRFVKELARMQRKITVYAYTHKQDVGKLREQLDNIIKIHVTPENKEQLLKRISNIQRLYQIFQETIKEEDLERLYKVKFAILVGDINRREDNPIEQVKDKQELEYYAKIVESKIEKILLLENGYFNALCRLNLSDISYDDEIKKIVEAFKRIVKSKSGNFSGDKILQDKRILGLIVAFDTISGMREFIDANYFKRTDTKYVLRDAIYKWNEELPFKTIILLDSIAEKEIERLKKLEQDDLKWDMNSRLKKDPLMNDFKLLCYSWITRITYGFSLDMGVEENGRQIARLILPEGIRTMGNTESVYEVKEGKNDIYEYALRQLIKQSKVIEFPRSLREIGSFCFEDCKKIKQIILNEGLVEIGFGAFCNCIGLRELILPKSVKVLHQNCFDSCIGLRKIFINEGIETIKSGAFHNTVEVNVFSIPAHGFKCKNMFTNENSHYFSHEWRKRVYGRDNRMVLKVRGTKLPRTVLSEFEVNGKNDSFDYSPFNLRKIYGKWYPEIGAIEYVPNNQTTKRCLVGYEPATTVLDKIKSVEAEYDKEFSNGEIE